MKDFQVWCDKRPRPIETEDAPAYCAYLCSFDTEQEALHFVHRRALLSNLSHYWITAYSEPYDAFLLVHAFTQREAQQIH